MVAGVREPRSREPQLLDVLREIQDASVTPWLCLEPAWRITSANPAFEALVGVEARRLVGQIPPFEFWPDADPARFTASSRRRPVTFVDTHQQTIAVDVDVFPIAIARPRPAAYVLRARPKNAAGSPDDAMWAIERLRSLETTLARVRHEIETVPAPRTPSVASDESLRSLSARERQVLDALLQGRRVSDVALDMGIAANTVRNHVKAIFRKVGVRSQTELLVRLRPTLRDE